MASRPRRVSSKQQALRQARPLLTAAEKGDREAAEVLVDLIEAAGGTQALAEDLLLVLQGRAIRRTHTFTGTSSAYGQSIERGTPLTSPKLLENQFKDALFAIRQRLFTHARPCMPGRKALQTLVTENARWTSAAQADGQFNRLWKALKDACEGRVSGRGRSSMIGPLHVANEVLQGHGVEHVGTEAPGVDFLYVNMGDTYVNTLGYDYLANRFRVASWGDMVETAERRAERAATQRDTA